MKAPLRKRLLEERTALRQEQVADKSRAIFRHWLTLWKKCRPTTVHTFLSIERFREVDTAPFIEFIRCQDIPVVLAAPRVVQEDRSLTHHLYRAETLVTNDWGIPEPAADDPTIATEDLDMILVPMLGFDPSGNRLGYGGGYYDRFLPQVRPDCVTVGLCFEFGRLPSPLPANVHDMRLDYVVTECGVSSFDLGGG